MNQFPEFDALLAVGIISFAIGLLCGVTIGVVIGFTVDKPTKGAVDERHKK